MNRSELSGLSAAELTDRGICPTCYNRENGGCLFGDMSDNYHVQLIPRYPHEERGSQNFVKPRGVYVPDPDRLAAVRRLIAEAAPTLQ